MPQVPTPLRLAVVNDFEVVVRGVAAMLAPYGDRVEIVELDSNLSLGSPVDIALYDAYSMPALDDTDLDAVVRDPHVRRTVLYTWMLTPELLENARQRGVDGAISKGTEAEDLVTALERIHSGDDRLEPFSEASRAAGTWPGKTEGLTARESEIVALVTDGLSNNEIARRTYLSINSVKSYIRSAYRTMGVTSRSQAVLWGIDHGFARNRVRIVHPNDQIAPAPTR